MLKINGALFFLFFFFEIIGQTNSNYNEEIEHWKMERVNFLKSEKGWLNLVGLFWLEEGKNSFGSAITNNIVFPKGSIVAKAGNFILENQTVTLDSKQGVAIKVHGRIAKPNEIVFSNAATTSAPISYLSLNWTVIKRENKIGIRLRDFNSPLVKSFTGTDRFPTDSNWKINAILEAPTSPSTIPITNVLGQIIEMKLLGKLIFKINDQSFSLDVVEEETKLFVILGDATNKKETYGGGRFMYIPKPDARGKTVIDFNKAFNPPCVFTPYATCPLPPKQNILPIPITAGEKTFNGY